MQKETNFLIYCMERYRHAKGLSGADVATLFAQHQVGRYLTRYFEALHTLGEHSLVQDIDDYLTQTIKPSA